MSQAIRPQLVSLEDRTTPATTRGLDFTFNGTGLVDASFDLGGSKADVASAIAAQPDGKIVVVGSVQVGATDVDFAVVRLNADGTFDKTFGDSGRRSFGFDLGGDNIDRATSVAIQSDGGIVVGGFAQIDAAGDFDFAVIRLTSTGDLDANFDKDGRQTIAFDVAGGTLEDKSSGVAIDSQGRILLAGSVAGKEAGDFDFGVARLASTGSIDPTFGSDGLQIVAFNKGGTNADLAAGIAVDAKDRAVIAGSVQTGPVGNFDFGLVRLTEAGAPDATFNGTGLATLAFNQGDTNSDTAAGVTIDSAGRILVAGTVALPAGNLDIGIARFTDAGVPDPTFVNGGKRTYGFDLGGTVQDRAAGLAVNAATGSIAIAATVETATAGDADIGLLRLTAGGDLDRSFSPNGRARVAFNRGGTNADAAAGLALDSSGRINVAGTAATTTALDTNIGIGRVVANTNLTQLLLAGGPIGGTARNFEIESAAYAFQRDSDGPSASAVTRTAVADLNGDGVADQILGAGPGGGSRVRILIGLDPAATNLSPLPPIEFDAFEGGFDGGVFVAAGDVDGDGRAELSVSPDVGGGPRVSVYSLDTIFTPVKRADFFGIDDLDFRGGARVAMGDINFDGRADLVVGAGFLGGPRVAIFAGATLFDPAANGTPPKLVNDFFAFPGADANTLRNGVFVAVGDLDGDGFGDLIFGGGPGGGPRVFALNAKLILAQQFDAAYQQPIANFFVVGDTDTRGGVRLAVKDFDGDARADLVTANGEGLPSRIRVYRGITAVQPNGTEPPAAQDFDPYGAAQANGIFVG